VGFSYVQIRFSILGIEADPDASDEDVGGLKVKYEATPFHSQNVCFGVFWNSSGRWIEVGGR
jgi:hypothetical protein